MPDAPPLHPQASACLLQVSDAHFGTERRELVEALVQRTHRLQPALVVLSGDITQRATAVQFAAAARFVERLAPVPVLAIPGNHDIPLYAMHERLFSPYRRYERAFGRVEDRQWVQGGWHVVALNTTRWWRHKHGEVSRRQVERVSGWLRAADPQAVKVVVTHQPLTVVTARDAVNRLRGAEAAVDAWQAAGADLVLGGHIHLPSIACARPDPRPLWAVQAGTALSHRVRGPAPNSVTELRAFVESEDDLRLGEAGRAPQRRCGVRFWNWDGRDFAPGPWSQLALGSRP